MENILAQVDELKLLMVNVAELVVSQRALYAMTEDSSRLLHERLNAVDDRKEMGRALVEQRARNLDLERQNYRYREELRISAHTTNSRSSELLPIRNLVQRLSNSRALSLISILAPKAKGTVDEIATLLDKLISERNAPKSH